MTHVHVHVRTRITNCDTQQRKKEMKRENQSPKRNHNLRIHVVLIPPFVVCGKAFTLHSLCPTVHGLAWQGLIQSPHYPYMHVHTSVDADVAINAAICVSIGLVTNPTLGIGGALETLLSIVPGVCSNPPSWVILLCGLIICFCSVQMPHGPFFSK